ncbi:hypothetical protein M5F00_14905 [Acinetobacter sp. ANC 4945]|uniref:Uncharacterized protein n=1 Tax=Acinetobacter amyesii TaxID=2942470 RepID=A0A1T1GRR0_9GAMM|nr:hypothetical protein [Acinetobacter amyesii]MCL6249145.1 hypothetical protein [Acinetobacter amyesii]OOV80299.1 hypothetical protein B1202_14420 [Acinetobacter amyesii]
MNNYAALNDLKSYLTQLRDEDLIWVLHVFKHPDIHRSSADKYHVLDAEIEILNCIEKLKAIKKIVIDYFEEEDARTIDDFLYDLKNHRQSIMSSMIEYSQIASNQRFLNFACESMCSQIGERKIRQIKNLYYKFLYMAYTSPHFFENPRRIEALHIDFDRVYSKFNTHFKFANTDFFIWAKQYINENPEFRRYKKESVEISEYEILINSIFDLIYIENENIHYALRKKLSNAWYQKKHREEKKVKKTNYYALTKKAKESLETLALKYNLSEERIIEKLINECFANECMSPIGKPLYD